MGVWTLSGTLDGTIPAAVMFDSCAGQAFGPMFADAGEIDEFLAYCRDRGLPDPRALSHRELEETYNAWCLESGDAKAVST